MDQLDEGQRLVARTVREFVDREVIPVASAMEHRDEYPDGLVETMKTLGLFGLNVPEEYGGNEVDYTTFAIVFEELARGWMGLAGILGAHLVLCDVLVRFGTDAQKQQFLPRLAKGEPRGGICLSEPNAGTDLQAITTTARRDGDGYRVDGSKMWVTNGRRAQIFLLLAKTDPAVQPPHRGISAFVIEKGAPGLTVGRDIDKMGYKTVETCELHFRNFPVPAANLIGGEEGKGFKQVMTGLEAERLNVAARGLGVARAAFERGDQVRAAAPHVRQADRAAPDDSNQAGRDGHQDRGVPLARSTPPPPRKTVASGAMSKPAWPNCLPPKRPPKCRSKRCAFLAAMASRRIFRSNGSIATRRCC